MQSFGVVKLQLDVTVQGMRSQRVKARQSASKLITSHSLFHQRIPLRPEATQAASIDPTAIALPTCPALLAAGMEQLGYAVPPPSRPSMQLQDPFLSAN